MLELPMKKFILVCCLCEMWLCDSAFSAKRASEVADSAMRGDKATLIMLLQKKIDVNAPQVDGATALHWAVYRDDPETVNLLITAGAKIDAANREGITPFYLACLYGNLTIVQTLLKAGSDPTQKGPSGETMIMLAARNGSPEIIKFLVARGADINAKEPLRGTTALMWAAEQKHPEAVKALVAEGADVTAKSGPAGLPRNYMATRVDTEAVKAHAQRQAAATAAGRTYDEQLAWEKEHGISPRVASRRQQTRPQTLPTEADDQDAVIAGLVGIGGGGLTPLIFASREGDIVSAKILIDAGADVNQITNYGWTPLLTATNKKHYKMATYLIDHCAERQL